MSDHTVTVEWHHAPHAAKPSTYDRNHMADYGHGLNVPVSAASAYLGDPTKADPEQLLVNAVSSCHMLFFLVLAEGQGYTVESYSDTAVGHVEKAADGSFWVSRIELSPKPVFTGEKRPDAAMLERLHHRAHKGCFIANSIKSAVSIRHQ